LTRWILSSIAVSNERSILISGNWSFRIFDENRHDSTLTESAISWNLNISYVATNQGTMDQIA
jgi:hypothetical protein